MTNAEKQEIINAVLAALATNSKTIAQLSPRQSLIDSDLFEVAGGSRVTYKTLRSLIREGLALESQLSNYVTGDAAMMYLAKLDTETGTVDYKESPLVMLDGFKGVNGYTPVTGDLYYENLNGYQIWIKTQGCAQGVIANTNVAYVNKNDGAIYRWTGSSMVRIGGSAVINDLVTGGEADALSAEMGKKMRMNIDIVNDKVNDLVGALANIAFLNGKPSTSDLDWSGSGSVTKHTVTLDTTGLVDCSVVETFPKQVADGEGVTITINPASGMSLAYASYMIGSSGTPVNVNITNNAAVITLTNITADITVYVTAAASDTVIGIAYHNVRMAGKTENNVKFADLVTGPAEPYSISPLFDLGADRSASVDVFFDVGANDSDCSILLFDSNKDYAGQVGVNSASGRTFSVSTGHRYVRFCYKNAYASAARISIDGKEVFKASTYDGVWGDYKDFRSSQFCPQPNADGDYVGWVPVVAGTMFTTNMTAYSSDPRSDSNQSWQTRIGTAAALASKAIPYTITKQLNIPASYKYTFRLTDANNLNPSTGMTISCLQLYSEVNGVISDMGKLTITTATTNNQDGSRTVNGSNYQGKTYSRLVIKTEHYNDAYYHDDTMLSVANDTNNEYYLWENFG